MAQQQQQNLRKFVLGEKDFDNKKSVFSYDHGWYSIVDVVGEENQEIYRSNNADEAYMKWNVYIGRKKERPIREDRDRGEERRGFDSRSRGGRSSSGSGERRSRSNEGDRRPDFRGKDRRSSVNDDNKTREKKNEKRSAQPGGVRNEKSSKNKKNYQGKNNHNRKSRDQYRRQDNKVKSAEWDGID